MSPELDAAYREAAAALRGAGRILVTAHENPDGDAFGSLVGAARGLSAFGCDVVLYASGDAPFPPEYAFLGTEQVPRRLPADVGDRLVLALDCGSAERIGAERGFLAEAPLVVNLDHHHDNTRFAAINVVDAAAPCTTFMVGRLLRELGVALTPEIALPLYVGLITDTGRFQYSNTTADALRFGAELLEHGVEPARVFRDVYESTPPQKAKLLGLALGRFELRAGGRLALTSISRRDFEATGADDTAADGVIDQLRAIRGVEAAAVIRETALGAPRYKVSLRSSAAALDVSQVARAAGGGGHVQAAGFSSDLELDALIAFIERELGGG